MSREHLVECARSVVLVGVVIYHGYQFSQKTGIRAGDKTPPGNFQKTIQQVLLYKRSLVFIHKVAQHTLQPTAPIGARYIAAFWICRYAFLEWRFRPLGAAAELFRWAGKIW